jgi:hypothetical protein
VVLLNAASLARLQKEWRSPVYAFFDPSVEISYTGIDNRRSHDFICAAPNCKGKGKNPRLVRRYLDTKDKSSTSSLRAHAINCWGKEIITQSAEAKDIASARKALAKAEMRDGSLTAIFERIGNGKKTYSYRQHTQEESRFVIPLPFCTVY